MPHRYPTNICTTACGRWPTSRKTPTDCPKCWPTERRGLLSEGGPYDVRIQETERHGRKHEPQNGVCPETQCTYSVDTESGIISVSGKGMECYFRIERLNDRAMTLCYRSDRNEYVAFSRCLLSSVTFVE